MNFEELCLDCAFKQKRGLHFILASIVIWFAVLIIINETCYGSQVIFL